MKVDTAGIDRTELARVLNAAYGLTIVALDFVPKGESGYHYVAVDQAGERHFVKVQARDRGWDLDRGLRVAAALHEACGLGWALAARRTLDGALWLDYAGYGVAVFPFLAGDSGFERSFTAGEMQEVAAFLAVLHRSDDCATLPHLPRAGFENPFEAPIRGALDAATTPDPGAGGYRLRVRRLLLAEQGDILAEPETMARLRERVEAIDHDWVLTHGDPNTANVVRDEGGRLHLLDWSEPAIAPRERDLFAFTEERFEEFLRPYLAVAGPVALRTEVFAFYVHLWVVQEIADYTTRILFRNTDPAEDEHAWEELAPYLPVPHAAMRRHIEGIETVLRRLGCA